MAFRCFQGGVVDSRHSVAGGFPELLTCFEETVGVLETL